MNFRLCFCSWPGDFVHTHSYLTFNDSAISLGKSLLALLFVYERFYDGNLQQQCLIFQFSSLMCSQFVFFQMRTNLGLYRTLEVLPIYLKKVWLVDSA